MKFATQRPKIQKTNTWKQKNHEKGKGRRGEREESVAVRAAQHFRPALSCSFELQVTANCLKFLFVPQITKTNNFFLVDVGACLLAVVDGWLADAVDLRCVARSLRDGDVTDAVPARGFKVPCDGLGAGDWDELSVPANPWAGGHRACVCVEFENGGKMAVQGCHCIACISAWGNWMDGTAPRRRYCCASVNCGTGKWLLGG